MSKRKKKAKFPLDRNGTPINVGDWLMFSDGPFHVATMTYYGDTLEAVSAWTAEDEAGEFCDNLSVGTIITYDMED